MICLLKGIVHPKIKLLSLTRPQVVPNLYKFLPSIEHRRRYLEECWSQDSWQHPLWKSKYVINFLVTHILLNIFFCVQQKK